MLELLTESGQMIPLLGSVLLTALICSVTERMEKCGIYIRVGVAAATAGGLFLLYRQILDGFALYWNTVADTFGSRAGIYFTRFDTADIMAEDTARLVFLIYLGMAAAVIGFLILRFRIYVLVFLEIFVLPFMMVLTGKEPESGVGVAFYMGIFLEINYLLARSGRKRYSEQSSRAFWFGGILTCLVLMAAGVFLGQIMPAADYASSELVEEAKQEALNAVNNLRYRKGKINSLPDGQLKKCGAWTASDETALKVTMEDPESLYLRGFTGSVYDGSSWKSIDTEDAYKQKNLFYWLHQDGFYGETQLNQARSLVEDDTLSDKISGISIENVKADSEYLYTPYEMAELPSGYEGETSLTDSMLKAKGFLGQKNYSFQTNKNLVKDFTVLGARIYQALAQGDDTAYREDESYYNTFVYSQDTELPTSLETLFRKELGDGGNREQGHTDYYTAISRIRAYLEKNMTYSTATDVYTEKGDFTENFLSRSKIGHSVHYATAAALMFRYYGIPSRYVEGYLITPEDIKDKKAGDTVEISGKNGHAWTEIYIDGLGWVPVEMTPEYYSVMKEADLTAGLEAKGAKAASIPEAESEPPAEENLQTHWSLKLALFGIEKLLILLLALFDTFCLVFILTVCGLRIRANYRRKKLFTGADDRLAVRAMAGYARVLYAHGSNLYSEEVQRQYREISRIGQRAAFSPHAVSEEERKNTAICIGRMKAELKKAKNWYENWIMKYIERLY